jgi:hypothetical protein
MRVTLDGRAMLDLVFQLTDAMQELMVQLAKAAEFIGLASECPFSCGEFFRE